MNELTPNNVRQERDLSSLSGTILLFSVISNGGYILNDFEFIVCLGPRAIFRSSSQNYSSFMLPDSVRLNAFSVLADNDRRKEEQNIEERERQSANDLKREGRCAPVLCALHTLICGPILLPTSAHRLSPKNVIILMMLHSSNVK